jgi:hypothetical protein
MSPRMRRMLVGVGLMVLGLVSSAGAQEIGWYLMTPRGMTKEALDAPLQPGGGTTLWS